MIEVTKEVVKVEQASADVTEFKNLLFDFWKKINPSTKEKTK